MQAAIDRVMQTYGMMANLTPVQEAVAREKVSHFLKDKGGDCESASNLDPWRNRYKALQSNDL